MTTDSSDQTHTVVVDWDDEGQGVPKVVPVPVKVPTDAVADWLSDTYGWCVKDWRVDGE